MDDLSRTRDVDPSELVGGGTDLADPPAFDLDRPARGTILEDRYEVGDLLGQGGMGYVLAARHVILGTRLALKVLRPELSRDPEMIERFRREARAASAIGHPNIVEVRDFGTLPSSDGVTPGASYFVMEHLDGQSLADAIEQDGSLSIERAVDVVCQMANALEAAHEHGIVHRDVKPENVILTVRNGRSDHVKILDFGIAKLDSAAGLSGAFRVLGTPAYMSPEQAQSRPLDGRSDVYSLGIVLYELLTGSLPFEDARVLEVIRLQVAGVPPSVLALRPDVPAVVAETIARALEKDPAQRPASMRAMVDMLASVSVSRSTELRRPSIVSAVPVAIAAGAERAVSHVAPPVHAPNPSPRPVEPSPPKQHRARSGVAAVLWLLGAAAVIALGAVTAIGIATRLRASANAPAPPVTRVVEVSPLTPRVAITTAPAAADVEVAVPAAREESPTVAPLHGGRTRVLADAPSPSPLARRAPPVVTSAPVLVDTPDPPVEPTRPTAQVLDPWQ